MIVNEDFFNNIDVSDNDVIENDFIDELKHELTINEVHNIHKQYECMICISFFNILLLQDSTITKLFNRLDYIFHTYGIEHSEYIMVEETSPSEVTHSYKFRNCTIFSQYDEFSERRDSSYLVYIYVNYPHFTYKQSFHFLYNFLSILNIDVCIGSITLQNDTEEKYSHDENTLFFNRLFSYLCYDSVKDESKIDLTKNNTKDTKRVFYKDVIRHFFGEELTDSELEGKVVPLKPIKLKAVMPTKFWS